MTKMTAIIICSKGFVDDFGSIDLDTKDRIVNAALAEFFGIPPTANPPKLTQIVFESSVTEFCAQRNIDTDFAYVDDEADDFCEIQFVIGDECDENLTELMLEIREFAYCVRNSINFMCELMVEVGNL